MEGFPRLISALRSFGLSGFVALGTLSSGFAVAQNAQPPEPSTQLAEVVVTAEYREEKLQDTPIAISAITAQDIEQRSFSDSFEVGYTVPNASFRPAQAAFGNTMTAFIRGVGQYDFDFAFEPGVGVYVDDVYQPFTMGTQMDLMDMDRVEVLRGPQGTLFGRGSIGGVVRLISKKAEGTDTGYIDLTPGSYKRIDLRAGYDFKLTDNLFARVTGVSRHSDGYQNVVDFEGPVRQHDSDHRLCPVECRVRAARPDAGRTVWLRHSVRQSLYSCQHLHQLRDLCRPVFGSRLQAPIGAREDRLLGNVRLEARGQDDADRDPCVHGHEGAAVLRCRCVADEPAGDRG
ncbi:MAG: hypothetical protein E6K34_16365 [Gammaproteobacteria bacterium]|nr:MAG: hypothetical protein E6K34_16365 [Gammaproteobacteria bacterium]